MQPSQVLIEVRAASLDPVDLKVHLIFVDLKVHFIFVQISSIILEIHIFIMKNTFLIVYFFLQQKLWIVLHRCLRVMEGGLGNWYVFIHIFNQSHADHHIKDDHHSM